MQCFPPPLLSPCTRHVYVGKFLYLVFPWVIKQRDTPPEDVIAVWFGFDFVMEKNIL